MLKWLLTLIIALVLLSALTPWLRRLGFGRLPGDIQEGRCAVQKKLLRVIVRHRDPNVGLQSRELLANTRSDSLDARDRIFVFGFGAGKKLRRMRQHLVANVIIETTDAAKGETTVGSNVIMVEYRMDQQRLFAGHQLHRLRRVGEDLKIAHKRVDLVNCQSAFEAIAVPI